MVALADLPTDWGARETLTQARGDAWLDARTAPLLQVPSVIVPVDGGGDHDILVSHRRPDVARITIARVQPCAMDLRLLRR